MSNDPKPADVPGSELPRLVSAWCDEAISDADLARLQTSLLADAKARMDFISLMGVHSGVKTEIVSQEHLESFVPLPSIENTATSNNQDRSQQLLKFQGWTGLRIWRLGWAAVLFVGAIGTGVAWYNWPLHSGEASPAISGPELATSQTPVQRDKPIDFVHDETESPEADRSEIDHSPPLAHVIEQTADCQWYFDRSGKVPTDMVRGGDTVRVTNGIMKLQFENETVVALHAPAIFEVQSEMQARVLLGKVTAKIGPKAKGFSVITPQATVVDLGTEFGIEVNEVGATDVVVFKGAVDVDYPTTLEGAARQQRLRTGEAVHLDASGTASRLVSITNGQFSDRPSEPLRPPLITAVRDNIQRQSAWNYYEIVHAGMAEDAKAFVDREAHEWNGVSAAGMPRYLLGGDYVKTFNNDKVKHDIEITVTVSRPCRLYILFDDRIPVPQWLQEGFRDTGDKIGVDEGPYVSNGKLRTEHQAGVGPGVSIDNIDSVWERDILVPGSVQLGATETPISSINMYGIVAVPLDEDVQKPSNSSSVHN